MLPLDKGELSSGGLGRTATHGHLLCLHSPYSRFPETWQRRKWAWKVKKHRGRGLAPTNGKRRRNVSACWSPHCRRMWQLHLLTLRYSTDTAHTSTIHYKCLNICRTSHRWQINNIKWIRTADVIHKIYAKGRSTSTKPCPVERVVEFTVPLSLKTCQ